MKIKSAATEQRVSALKNNNSDVTIFYGAEGVEDKDFNDYKIIDMTWL